ncbi:replication/maintenance protein RepL [Streptomyces sp. NPDC090053]|uniref:replication/maintenance protein RepL n=1 Tax=Streptomyces sp. NPDC090053 TaxID=3365932 RepID=UPI0037F9CE4C
MTVPGFHNPVIWETLPNARLNLTSRDVFDILSARQSPGGEVHVKQKELAERLGISLPAVSRAMSALRDAGLVEGRTRHGKVLIHPLFAGYESAAHMDSHLRDPGTFIWPLNFPSSEIRPPRRNDPRAGTDYDPDPDGGDDASAPEQRPTLRLAG